MFLVSKCTAVGKSRLKLYAFHPVRPRRVAAWQGPPSATWASMRAAAAATEGTFSNRCHSCVL
eukprot:952672-Pyramimonas_sp.AAC.1